MPLTFGAAGLHSTTTTTNLTLWSWGYNPHGEMGIGVAGNRPSPYYSFSSPVQVGRAANWASVVASAYDQVFAQNRDGKLYSWGHNAFGSLGLGDVADRSSPTLVGTLTTWRRPTSGSNAGSAGIIITPGQIGGKAYWWGSIPSPSFHPISSPVQMGSFSDWTDWQTQEQFFLGIRGGMLYGIGNNDHFQLGLGYLNGPAQYNLTRVGTNTNWLRTIDKNFTGSLALTTDNRLWAWGFCGAGEAGFGTTGVDISVPVQVNDKTWSSVVGMRYTVFGIDTNGLLWCWGSNNHGQLGLNLPTTTPNQTSPAQIGTEKWLSIAGGRYQAVGVKANGTLWSWGSSVYGALGHGNLVNYSSPVQVGTDNTWVACTCMQYTSFGLKRAP